MAQHVAKRMETADTPQRRPQGAQGAHVPVALRRAAWRTKRMWPTLALLQLGMLTAVVLLCSVPLFARVATVAGLRGALTSNPNFSYWVAHGATDAPTPAHLDEAERRFTASVQQYFAAFDPGTPVAFELSSTTTPFTLAGQAANAGRLGLYGVPSADLPNVMRLVRGRLPQPLADPLEIAVTPATLLSLHLDLGSSLTMGYTASDPHASLLLVVVGVVEPEPVHSAAHGLTVPSSLDPNGSQFWGVVSTDAVSVSSVPWGAFNSPDRSSAPADQRPAFWTATWTYHARLSHLEQITLDDPEHYQKLRYESRTSLRDLPGMSQVFIDSNAPDMLYTYAIRIVYVQIVTYLLLIVVLGLVLLFLRPMAAALVERQAALIATLRSRGASRGQVSRAFLLQNLSLGAVAFVAGPLLAIPFVRGVSSALLPAEDRGALATLDGLPLSLTVLISALVAVVVTVVGTHLAVRRAAKSSVLALRQETARDTAKPLWQRLYLDVLAAVLALTGYGTFALATVLATSHPTLDSDRIRYSISPLALVAPPFLTIAAALLFLGLFPRALQLGEHLAARRRGEAAMLALTQLARATRPAMRMTLLLALASCFALFTLTTLTTTAQRIEDVSVHQAGADFSGSPIGTARDTLPTPAGLTQTYQAIPDVLSATAGYRADVQQQAPDFTANPSVNPNLANPPIIQLVAIDPSTFAGTTLWSEQDSSEPLAQLTALLRDAPAQATTQNAVPAVVDAQLWTTLQLSDGKPFALPFPGAGTLRFVAVRRVEHIPTTFASTGFNFGPATGGMLVNYASFAAAYATATGDTGQQAIAPNFVWLKTKDDPASLASVRSALASGPLQLGELQLDGPALTFTDRRALVVTLHADPMYLHIVDALGFGAAAALALAVLGTLIASWLWMREQLSALALLRALGMEAKVLRRMLQWQQGIVTGAALCVGVALGAILTVVVTPTLVDLMFSNNLGSAVYSTVTGNPPPVRLALSLPWLALTLAALAVVCAAATALAARRTMRASLSQTLRLDDN